MSGLVEFGDGRFLIGDAPSHPGPGNHWCASCSGSGVGFGYEGELVICSMCDGMALAACTRSDCDEHPQK